MMGTRHRCRLVAVAPSVRPCAFVLGRCEHSLDFELSQLCAPYVRRGGPWVDAVFRRSRGRLVHVAASVFALVYLTRLWNLVS